MPRRGNAAVRLTARGEPPDLETLAEIASTSTFTTTHYDTPGRALTRVGVELRRTVQNGKSIWRLGLPRGQRMESVGGPARPPAPLRALLVALLRDAAIEPLATLRTRRTNLRATRNGSHAALVLDSVAVMEGRRVAQTFSELEIVGQERDRLVRDLARRIRRQGAEPGERRPDILRALGLLVEPPSPPASPAAPIEHVGAMLGVQMTALLAHDPGVRLGTDPEDLHRFRVAVRRTRAILRAAGPLLDETWADELRSELGWLGRVLGPGRDADVLLERLRGEIASLEGEAFAAERLVHELEAERELARAAMLEDLESARYFGLLDRLDEAAANPVPSGRSTRLETIAADAFADLRKAASALSDDPTNEELHRFRIQTKRSRYAAELAQPAVGKPARSFVKRAAMLQDVLGTHQDAVVAEARIRELAPAAGATRVACAAGRLIEREAERRRQARAAVSKTWRKAARAGREAWA